MTWPAPSPDDRIAWLAEEMAGKPMILDHREPWGTWRLADSHDLFPIRPVCATCDGKGIESNYSGIFYLPSNGEPNRADIRLRRVSQRVFDRVHPPGVTFYGGSEHHQCRRCKGTGKEPDEPGQNHTR